MARIAGESKVALKVIARNSLLSQTVSQEIEELQVHDEDVSLVFSHESQRKGKIEMK